MKLRATGCCCLALVLAGFFALHVQAGPVETPPAERSPDVRCAVIGGLIETGLWPALMERFEQQTGRRAALVATGPKHLVADALAEGNADLVTMHNCDAIVNLVADGYGENPRPWVRNDLLLVGPPDDPAGVRGEKDAAAALKRIVAERSKIMVHASQGANEVLADLLARGGVELDPEHTLMVPADKHRQMLKLAAREKAYTLVGRIPFLAGKIPADDLAIMVQGDARLRRPYLLVTTASEKDPRRRANAKLLAEFLLSPDTQAWIAEFGRDQLDELPLFFPVALPK